MKSRQIAIVTVVDDLHALAVRRAFAQRNGYQVHIVEANYLANDGGLSWLHSGFAPLSMLPTRDGGRVAVEELDLIWWRRANNPQELPAEVTNADHIDLINNDCAAALLGMLLTDFHGVWVSHPAATRAAENKLVQLRAAQRAGLRTPRTLVSQDPEQIRRFCAELGNQVIVKPVRGTNRTHLLTQRVTDALLASTDALRICPAIYQEYITGVRHIRAHCFGPDVHSVLIESPDLDWRGNLEIPFSPYALPVPVARQLCQTMALLDLRMGIVDLKLTEAGEVVWLEVNPQGQFLFCEGLGGLDLITPFVDFLADVVQRPLDPGPF